MHPTWALNTCGEADEAKKNTHPIAKNDTKKKTYVA